MSFTDFVFVHWQMWTIKVYGFRSAISLSLIFHQLGYLPMTLPARLMAVAPFQESSIVTLNFILVLGVTSQCVDDKGLNAADVGICGLVVCSGVFVGSAVRYCFQHFSLWLRPVF